MLAREALLTPYPDQEYAEWLIPKFLTTEQGSQLTNEQIASMMVGPDITPQERELLAKMLYNREAAIAFSFKKMGIISHDVAPTQEI